MSTLRVLLSAVGDNPEVAFTGTQAIDTSAGKTAPNLHIYTASGIDDGAYCPPAHINVYGEKNITALRDFCNALLNETNLKPT